AALRRAWVSDPVIRDFIGIAENQWDFTNPTTIPGFGPLHETGDKLSLIAQPVPTLDRSLAEFSARLSDTDASAEKTRSVTASSRGDEMGDTSARSRPHRRRLGLIAARPMRHLKVVVSRQRCRTTFFREA